LIKKRFETVGVKAIAAKDGNHRDQSNQAEMLLAMVSWPKGFEIFEKY